MNYKISGGKALLRENGILKTEEKDLFIREGKISFRPFQTGEVFEEFDARGMLVMPGLVNMHTHAYMTIMRNYADDVGFSEWLFKRVMPVEDSMPREMAYWASLLACMEMIRTGTTCFVDMHMYHRQSPMAARDAGMHPLQCTWFHDLAFEPHIPCPILDEFDHAGHQSDVLSFCK